MTPLWIASMVLQWLMIGALSVIALSLVRQFGVLSIRLNPSAGFDTGDGPGPGTEIPELAIDLFPRGEYSVGGARANPQLLVFLSPDCSVCTTVANFVRAIGRSYGHEVDVLAVVQGTPRVVREFAEAHRLDVPVALRQNVPNTLAPNSTPYGLAITKDGTVAARGVPNALDHLEEMIKVARNGLPMSADSVLATHNWGDALPTNGDIHVTSEVQP